MADRAHSHVSHHSHGERWTSSDRVARLLRWLVIGCGVAVVIGAVAVWPSGEGGSSDPLQLSADPIEAHVTIVEELPCVNVATETCTVVSFELRSGDLDGVDGSFETGAGSSIDVGDDILVTAVPRGDGGTLYSFFDHQRTTPVLVLVALFVGAVLALGRWRGLGALVGLGASLGIIVWFALPSLTDGNNAVAVALVTAAGVAVIALYLAHGVSPATDVALLSTLVSLALTGALAWLFVELGQLTGYTDDASFVLQSLGTGVDPRGILLASVVIGSLGVLDDVTVTQVSAVMQLHRARPDASRRELFGSALTIGRDHISSTVNTLFLAYAGAALPLLLLFSSIDESIGGVATREVVATEIVRALVGSIGLVAAVPIATSLATLVVHAGTRHST